MSELKLQQSRLDGRYDILECLGRGSYAEIYVAADNAAPEGAPRTIVIKALNLYLQDTPDLELEHTLVTNFQNEAVALDRVRHPNVINRLGHGTAIDLAGTTFHYIVLEYLPGGDLYALTKTRPLSIKQALFYLEQVCSGLAHAHKCGVIHRDIKPQNLLLTADEQVVKIADFGVARIDATEGAITRVGTNIYSAPEHNPLMQTGQLDTGSLRLTHDHLTPAADIYSLAKTTYTLIAGESPRRFAQHAITELPLHARDTYWSNPVLRVLEKATQNRPDDRYQTVEEFWDELSDASLPPTRPLQMISSDVSERRKPSQDLSIEPEEEFTEAAPPRPQFVIPDRHQAAISNLDTLRRPRIVVPISVEAQRQMELRARQELEMESRGGARFARTGAPVGSVLPASKKRRALVALGLILAFSGMLLATHKYVTTRWNPLSRISQPQQPPVEQSIIGRQGVTTTDVNLRPVASSANVPIGLAESGSKVKVLSADNNWYEVQVVEHARPKTDPYSSDRGWINKRYVKFD
ncbi:MAG TPA: serine/threonine protein kinase [Pyrinomonadaceae bacterium]|nr:serine/threonine protein kinase [Pyrinomonadaceae bacterium]